MEKLNSEEFKQNSQNNEKGYSIIQLILGAVMVAIGYQNLPADYKYSAEEIQELSVQERDPCPNGAAYWLYIAGILLLVANFMNGWSKFYKWMAERDGKVDKCEKFNMMVNSFSTGCMTIVDFAMLIWGSVVVFGAWATWTDDYAEYEKDPEAMNYCMNQPMMTAFVILILKWVLIPCMIVLSCLCGCCCACCCGMCASKGQNQNA